MQHFNITLKISTIKHRPSFSSLYGSAFPYLWLRYLCECVCVCMYNITNIRFFPLYNSLSKLRISSSSLKLPVERMLNLLVSRRTLTLSSSRSDALVISTLLLSRTSLRLPSSDNLSLLVSYINKERYKELLFKN